MYSQPTFPEPYTMKEFAANRLGLHSPKMEPSFGFCQQHLEFPSGLPSKSFPEPMMLYFSVQTRTGVSNKA